VAPRARGRENFKPTERVKIAEKVEAAIRRKMGRPLNLEGESPEIYPDFKKVRKQGT
jgi:hypothetical protein